MLYKLNPTRKEKGRLEITGDGWRFQHGRHEEALAAGVRGAHGLRSKKPRPYVTRAYVAWYSMVWSYSCAAVRSSETSIRSIASPLLVLVVVGGGLRIFFFSFFLAHFYFAASESVVVKGAVPSPPRFLPSIFIAHRVKQSHCSSILYRVSLTHAFALSLS